VIRGRIVRRGNGSASATNAVIKLPRITKFSKSTVLLGVQSDETAVGQNIKESA
jgi:hypothetical protein